MVDLLDRVKTALHEDGSGWEFLKARCEQIVVFGSTAEGNARPDSDIDLLCLGKQPMRPIGGHRTQLLWRDPPSRFARSWLGCRIANAIACRGLWIHGRDDWSHLVFRCPLFVEAERLRLTYAVRGLRRDRVRRVHRELVWLAAFAAGEPLLAGDFDLGDFAAAAAAAGVLLPPRFRLPV